MLSCVIFLLGYLILSDLMLSYVSIYLSIYLPTICGTHFIGFLEQQTQLGDTTLWHISCCEAPSWMMPGAFLFSATPI